jgi:hypothetical protein
MTRCPRSRRRHSHAAATAISGSHSARSWTYTGLVGRPLPRRNAAGPPLISAGTILLSQATAFAVTMTQTWTATPRAGACPVKRLPSPATSVCHSTVPTDHATSPSIATSSRNNTES